MTFVTTHEQVALSDHAGKRLSRGLGLAIGAGVSAGLWALLIYGAVGLFA